MSRHASMMGSVAGIRPSCFLSSVSWLRGCNRAGVHPCHHRGSHCHTSCLPRAVREKRRVRLEWEDLVLKLLLSFLPLRDTEQSLNF